MLASESNLTALNLLLRLQDSGDTGAGSRATMDPNRTSRAGVTALFYAVRCRDPNQARETITFLCKFGCDINFQEAAGGKMSCSLLSAGLFGVRFTSSQARSRARMRVGRPLSSVID